METPIQEPGKIPIPLPETLVMPQKSPRDELLSKATTISLSRRTLQELKRFRLEVDPRGRLATFDLFFQAMMNSHRQMIAKANSQPSEK